MHCEYTLKCTTLKRTDSERDLGVLVEKSFKFSDHCNKVANSANAVIGMIKRTITCSRKDIMIKLYKALARS